MKTYHTMLPSGLRLLLLVSALNQTTFGQGTAFTFQGRLNDGGGPSNGTYDLRFTIYDSTNSPGTVVAGPLTVPGTLTSSGLFTVILDFGPGIFNGSARWMEIAVRTNGATSFTTLSPRQPLTPSPYAITASNLSGTLSSSSLSGTYSSPVSLLNAANVFSGAFTGNGSGLTSLNASELASGTVPDARLAGNVARTNQVWLLNGNVGTSPTNGNFLGTKDFQPLELWAGGMRVLRLQPDNGNFAGNLIGGFTNNLIESGSGNVIAGGGYPNSPNIIHSVSFLSSIGGGEANQIGGVSGADFAVIAGGAGNAIGSLAQRGVIGGGLNNTISSNANNAIIAGGSGNLIGSDGNQSVIVGGISNINAEFDSVIGGGQGNFIQPYADHAFIGGGFGNTIGSNSPNATIPGGYQNTARSAGATIGGGMANVNSGNSAVIAGGDNNQVQPLAQEGTISGGSGNSVASLYDSIGGGSLNLIGTNSNSGTIAGGFNNVITNGSYDGAIGGGSYHFIGSNSYYATIAGGHFNIISNNAIAPVIGGGDNNSIGSGASYATVPGGYLNVAAGNASLAAGNQAQALHDGTFVWADNQPANFASTTSNQFSVRALGGVRFVTGGAGVTVDGGVLELQPPRLPDDSNHSNIVNVIEGSSANVIASNVYGATISGGGGSWYGGYGVMSNSIAADFATISGGGGNTNNGIFSVVGGGYSNVVQSASPDSTIGGGIGNLIQAGSGNGTIGGGYYNTLQGSTHESVIAGGSQGTISSNVFNAFLGGGWNNLVSGNYSMIGGGLFNNNGGFSSVIGGGEYNQTLAPYTTLGGGYSNTASVISSTVGGGFNNSAAADSATVSGGVYNSATGPGSVVSGGIGNLANAYAAVVSGGISNNATAINAFVAGGSNNIAAGPYSFAAGIGAQALNNSSFVWSDGSSAGFSSTGPNQFLIRSAGGVAINTNNPGAAALNVAGTVKATSFQGDGSGLFNVSSGALGNYLFAYSTATQTPAAANTYQDVTFGADAQINGWTHTAGASQYTNNQIGIYIVNYEASAQATLPAGTNIILHATLNAVEIPGSRVFINTVGPLVGNGSRSFLASANAGDVLALQFLASSTGARLLGSPSVSMTITRVQ